METQTTHKSFSELIRGNKPVLVDFFAEWCGPCKLMQPILKDLKHQIGDDITVIKIDVDRNPQTAAAYQVQGVPTLIFFRQGEIKWRKSGVVSAKDLQNVYNQLTGQL